MTANFEIPADFIAERNKAKGVWLAEDFEFLGKKLRRRDIEIERLVERARGIQVAIPSWGVGTGGTRFARFPGLGEPRNIYEKLEDCSTINNLVCSTSSVSLHIPWDKPQDAGDLLDIRCDEFEYISGPAGPAPLV